MPTFDLNSWSAWASIGGLIVSLIGLALSVWVLRRTGSIAEAVRETKSAVHRQNQIRKVDDLRKAFHNLARQYDASEEVEARELFGRMKAMALQLQDMPDTNIKGCLDKIVDIGRTYTASTLLDICELLTELNEHLKEYEQQAEILGRGQ